jgi:CAAX prenyl protease-like protein
VLSPVAATLEERYPSLPYVLPFGVFLAFLAAAPYLEFLGSWEFPIRSAALIAVLWFFSRHVISFRLAHPAQSILLGVAVFALWIAPDMLIPGYRNHWIFQNAITGQLHSSIAESLRSNPMVLIIRSLRAAILVPIVEELFWRAWLMRWIISTDFKSVPLGTYRPVSMWITALLFASEHGPYWEVGLLTGLIYNWWMIRTKSLGDCILVHGVTNACLSTFVLLTGNWEYWM